MQGGSNFKWKSPPAVHEYTVERGHKQYELSDHLGNVQATISDRKVPVQSSTTISHYLPVLLTRSEVYPFGWGMPGRSYNGGEYRYGFNGKENDNEVKGTGNQQDYGFRIYDPRLGRFLSTDPLFAEYPWYTPYQFAGNKPIRYIDLDGLEEFDVMMNKKTGSITISVANYRKIRTNSTGVRVNYYSLNEDGTKVKVRTSNQFNYGPAQSLQKKYALDEITVIDGGYKKRDGWKDSDGTTILSRTIPKDKYFKEVDISFRPNTADVTGDDFEENIDNVIEMMQTAGDEGTIIVRPNAAFRGGSLENDNIRDLMQQRGERVKGALMERGIDSERIEINLGNPNSGGTNTEFELK